MKKDNNIVGKKIFFEYLRYLQNWKYGDFKQYKHEIIRRKLFLDDYRNLGNFSHFGYIFGKYICLSSELNYHGGKMGQGMTIPFQAAKKDEQFLLEKSW